MNVLLPDRVLMCQHAFHEDETGRPELRGTDTLALEVRRRLDARVGAHIDAGVAKHLRQRHRDADERTCAAALQRRIGGERQLRYVELLLLQHARERLARPHHLDVEIDAFGLDAAVDQRAGAVVIPAGKCELEICAFTCACSSVFRCESGHRFAGKCYLPFTSIRTISGGMFQRTGTLLVPSPLVTYRCRPAFDDQPIGPLERRAARIVQRPDERKTDLSAMGMARQHQMRTIGQMREPVWIVGEHDGGPLPRQSSQQRLGSAPGSVWRRARRQDRTPCPRIAKRASRP